MVEDNFSSKVVKGFAWVASTKFIVQVVQWVSTIFVARLLLPENYGVFALATVFTGFMEFIVDLGFSAGLVHKSNTTREEEDGVFYTSMMTGLILYILLFFMAPIIADFYSSPELVDVIRVIAVCFILGSLKVVPEAVAMQQLNFRYRALVEMTAGFVSAITAIGLAMLGYNVWALVYALVVNRFVLFIGYLPLFTHIPSPRFSFNKIKGILLFGASNLASGLIYYIYSRAEIFIAGRFIGEKQVGYFTMAHTLAEIPLDRIGMIFNKVTFPSISKIKSDQLRCKSFFLKTHFYLLVIAYPIILGLYLVAEDLINILLTEKWLPIVPVLQIYCIINLMKVSSMIMSPTLLGRGKPNTVLRYNVICLVIFIPAIFIGLRWGLMGMLYALVIANIFPYGYLLFSVMKDLDIGISELLSSVKSVFISISIMVGGVLLTKHIFAEYNQFVILSASVASGVIFYVLAYFTFFRSKLSEIQYGISLLRT